MFVDTGSQGLPSAREMVRRWRIHLFAPITTTNDATRALLTGAAMMHEFARRMERKEG